MNEPVAEDAERRDPPEARMHEHRRAPRRTARRIPAESRGLRRYPERATRSQPRRRTSRAASTTNSVRQCVTCNASSSRTVATSAPMPPASMIQPAYDACRSARIPGDDRLQRRHQACAHAGADHRARHGEPGERFGEGESAAPLRRDGQQHRLDAARTEAVEQHARRQLHRGEREEIRARQKAERRRIEREIARPAPAK